MLASYAATAASRPDAVTLTFTVTASTMKRGVAVLLRGVRVSASTEVLVQGEASPSAPAAVSKVSHPLGLIAGGHIDIGDEYCAQRLGTSWSFATSDATASAVNELLVAVDGLHVGARVVIRDVHVDA